MPVNGDLFLLWNALLGQATPADASPTTINRTVALICALHATSPEAVEKGMAGTTDTLKRARRYEDWLGQATRADATLRRTLLMMVCAKAAPNTHRDRTVDFANALLKHATH